MTQHDTQPSNANRLPRLQLTNWQIIMIALVIVGGRLVIDFSQRIVEGQQKISEQRALEAQLQALVDEQKTLEAAKAYYSSPAFVEVWAHDQGKMVRDGEVLVIPLYERTEQQAVVTGDNFQGASSQSTSPLPPWRVWWTLFFDGNPPTPSSSSS